MKEPTPESLIAVPADGAIPHAPDSPHRPARHNWFKRNWKWLMPAILFVLASGGVLTWLFWPKSNPVTTIFLPSPSPTASPTPTQKASPLTGVMVGPALAGQPWPRVVSPGSKPSTSTIARMSSAQFGLSAPTSSIGASSLTPPSLMPAATPMPSTSSGLSA
jgi:hypothetical protein